jgi:hypothetical protein
VDKAKASSSKINASVEALAEGGNGRIEGEKGEEEEGSSKLPSSFLDHMKKNLPPQDFYH